MKGGLLSLGVALLIASCGAGSPNLIIDQTEIDLGKITNGEVRVYEIQVHNGGGRELVIEAVTTSCGCTTAELKPSVIAPGASGVLQVRYDSGAHGPEATGPVMRQVFIASNDVDKPEVEIRFTAEVVPALP